MSAMLPALPENEANFFLMSHQLIHVGTARWWASPYTFMPPAEQRTSLSSEELTWLQANALIDPPIGNDNSFLNNTCDSASSTSLSNSISFDSNLYLPYIPTLPTSSPTLLGFGSSNSPVEYTAQTYARPLKSPCPEWIYRRPKPPVHARSHCISPSRYPSHLKGRALDSSSLSRYNSTPRTRTSFGRSPDDNAISGAADPFSSTIFHPRSHSEQSSLKNTKSPSETALKHTPSSPARSKVSSPKLMTHRPPSISSTSSISTSTSRSSSPRTPASVSSSPYSKPRRPLPYRPHPESDSTLPPSCPQASKSILTRTSSFSTKDSSFTGNKSVKFAAVPVIHYATASYWDLENFDKEETTMGINIDAMDVDDSYHGYHTRIVLPKGSSGILDIAKLRESQCATPTPEREKAKTKGLKRLMSLTRKPLATTATSTSVATVSPHSPRPVISMPYALGTHPMPTLRSNVSLPYSAAGTAGSAPELTDDKPPLRSAPSFESFRSSKSSAARSICSMGSVKSSTSSTRSLRTWLSRWTWSGQLPER